MLWAYDKRQGFFHGERPKGGKASAEIMAFVMPVMSGTEETGMDPLEMLLNPEDSFLEVSYLYFHPYDWVRWKLGNHVGDIENTEVYF